MPTARDPWSLLSQAPGVLVDRVNVGGNESGQQSNFIGVGSGSRDNTFAVDGVILTDMNAVGASATYFDFGAFEEVQFTVSSADVTVPTSGVLINQVTKRGTNEWRGTARYLGTDGSLQSEPKQEDGNKIDSVEEYGADIGGPLMKDHLWIWGAYGVSDIHILAQGRPARQDQAEGLQLQAELPDRAEQLGGPPLLDQRQAQVRARRGPRHALPGRPTTRPRRRTSTRSRTASSPTSNLASPASGRATPASSPWLPRAASSPSSMSTPTASRSGSSYDFKQDATIDQERLDASYFFNTGSAGHELKFGGSFREQENDSGTVWPHGNRVFSGEYLGLDPGIAQVEFFRNRKNKIVSSYGAAWLQDTVSLDRLDDQRRPALRPPVHEEPGQLRPGRSGSAGAAAADRLQGQRRRRLQLEHRRASRQRHLRPGQGPPDAAARHLLAVRRAARPAPAGHPRQPDRLHLRLLLLRGRQQQPGPRSRRGGLPAVRLHLQHRSRQPDGRSPTSTTASSRRP